MCRNEPVTGLPPEVFFDHRTFVFGAGGFSQLIALPLR